MRRDRTHIVVVMDEQGGTAGLLTVKDLFDEVVGPIEEADQDGDAKQEIYRDARGQLRVAGTVRLDELAEAAERPLPESEAETVSGLVLLGLGRPAAVGDVVTHGPLQLLVVATEGRGVKECLVLSFGS